MRILLARYFLRSFYIPLSLMPCNTRKRTYSSAKAREVIWLKFPFAAT